MTEAYDPACQPAQKEPETMATPPTVRCAGDIVTVERTRHHDGGTYALIEAFNDGDLWLIQDVATGEREHMGKNWLIPAATPEGD